MARRTTNDRVQDYADAFLLVDINRLRSDKEHIVKQIAARFADTDTHSISSLRDIMPVMEMAIMSCVIKRMCIRWHEKISAKGLEALLFCEAIEDKKGYFRISDVSIVEGYDGRMQYFLKRWRRSSENRFIYIASEQSGAADAHKWRLTAEGRLYCKAARDMYTEIVNQLKLMWIT